MKNTFRASWRFLLVLIVISLGQVAVDLLSAPGWGVVAGVGPGPLEKPGALPLHVQRARRVLLGAADLLGDGLEACRLLDEQNQLRGPQDPLAPEVGAAVRLQQRRRRRQIGVLVESLLNHLERAARALQVVGNLARQEM